MATITETVYAVRKTRKGAQAVAARDEQWLADGIDLALPEGTPHHLIISTPYVRVSKTTLEVRKADDGTFQVVQVTRPVEG